MDYFLGIEVSYLLGGSLFLSQAKYIRDLLVMAHMDSGKGISTPMVYNNKLTRLGSNYVADPTLYRSIVGALQYATITRA